MEKEKEQETEKQVLESKEESAEEKNTAYDELNDKYLRTVAEYDNFRKRTLKEKSDLLKYAGEDLATSILSTLDNFERALNSPLSEEGIQLIYSSLIKNLENKGVSKMECVGKTFDIDLMEAIMETPAGEDMKGKVIDVVENGYYLNDKVIRFAKVIVGS